MARSRNFRAHRWIRQIHLWVGAWGAIAAIVFGLTGFIQDHRAVLKLPQGKSTEVSSVELSVPEPARASADAMLAWLRDVQHVDVESQRGPSGRGRESRWVFVGGNARTVTQAEYIQDADSIAVRTSVQSPLAVLGRLHKGVGGGIAWIVLADSFALAMIALGISGLVMWGRGRSARQMSLSIVGVAVLVLLVIGGSAVI